MRKENASFDTKFISEAGSYLVNADYFAFVELKDYACYVVADGIDIDEKKESARLAVTTVITEFSENPGMSSDKLKRYLKAAHKALLGEADEIRLEASIVVLLTDYKKAIWGHAGNARLLWIKNGAIKAMTRDTSLTQRMAENEEIPLDQVSMHEERNNLYTYLGQPGRFTPVISGKKKLEDGDIFLLETRGAWETIGEAEIIDAVEGVSQAEEVCTGLEDVILSQRLEVIENYTIASVFVNKIYNNPKAGKYKKIFKIVLSVVMALLMVGLSVMLVLYNKNKSSLQKMDKYKEKGTEYLEENNYSSADKQFASAYEIAQDLKVRKNSKNETKVNLIENYNKMAEDMSLGMDAIEDEEYKKAASLFEQALQIAQTLKESYAEDIDAYEPGIRAYLNYAQYMTDGKEDYNNQSYDEAIDCFADAASIMDDINDTAKRDAANKLLDSANAKKATASGLAFEEKGDEYNSNGEYEKAQTQYESAQEMYDKAKDYGDSDAANKSSMVAVKAENAKNSSEKRTDQEKLSTANDLEKQGDAAAQSGNKEEAAACYSQAVDLLEDITALDVGAQLVALKEKNNQTAQDPEQELFNAIDCLSRGDSPSAITALESAKEIYTNLNDKSSAQLIQTYINNINNLIAEQQAAAQAVE
jgi:serine/threonine protein phosphatase PrpC